jgi:hypothetical protein
MMKAAFFACLVAVSSALQLLNTNPKGLTFSHLYAQFGTDYEVEGPLILAEPADLCETNTSLSYRDAIVLVLRGDCPFLLKAANAEALGAAAVVIGNNDPNFIETVLTMGVAADASEQVNIPVAAVSFQTYSLLKMIVSSWDEPAQPRANLGSVGSVESTPDDDSEDGRWNYGHGGKYGRRPHHVFIHMVVFALFLIITICCVRRLCRRLRERGARGSHPAYPGTVAQQQVQVGHPVQAVPMQMQMQPQAVPVSSLTAAYVQPQQAFSVQQGPVQAVEIRYVDSG